MWEGVPESVKSLLAMSVSDNYYFKWCMDKCSNQELETALEYDSRKTARKKILAELRTRGVYLE